MSISETTKKQLTEHYKKYPELQLQDIFKYIYQSSFGCEHMLSSYETAVDYIRKEYENAVFSLQLSDKLDGEYSRVHFSVLQQGLRAETFAKLFYLSAKKEANSKAELKKKIAAVKELVTDAILPFSAAELEKELERWHKNGYSAVHHSDAFRLAYKPSYRVIADEFVAFLPLFIELDKMLSEGSVIVAVDGGCGSGKTTLGEMLKSVYDCTVLHMDDFFLRPEQRIPERYAEAGGNVDRERFLQEVLIPLSERKPVDYRRFNCATLEIEEAQKVYPEKLTVIEGTYSMHPYLAGYYDFSVFLDIDKELQKKRIEKRNSPEFASRFFNEWIPMENKYFSEMNVKNRCSIVFDI